MTSTVTWGSRRYLLLFRLVAICCSISAFVRPAPLMVPASGSDMSPSLLIWKSPESLSSPKTLTRILSPGASRSSTGELGAGEVGSEVRHPAVNNASAKPTIARKQRPAVIINLHAGPREGYQEAKLWWHHRYRLQPGLLW